MVSPKKRDVPHVVLIKSDEMFWLFYPAVIKERKEEEITGLIKRDSSGSPFTISMFTIFNQAPSVRDSCTVHLAHLF
jgi:hypothetical protein